MKSTRTRSIVALAAAALLLGFSTSVSAQSQYNTAYGTGALQDNKSGAFNTALGTDALQNNTIGGTNTATGASALNNNTSGDTNTATGAIALYFNTTGATNTATGYLALFSNLTGNYNTAMGTGALVSTDSGSSNTALGLSAGVAITSGSGNTAIGSNAGENQTTGSNNIYIDNQGVAEESDTIHIGDTQTSTFISGIFGTTTGSADAVAVMVDGNGQLGTVSSSVRYKEAIRDLGQASKRLLELRPVRFRYKAEVQTGERPVEYGLLAEEVAQVMPELVVYDEQGRPETVRYHILSTLLVNELQDLHKRSEAVRKELLIAVQAQHEENAMLRARLSEIESLVGQLAAAQNVNLNTAAWMD